MDSGTFRQEGPVVAVVLTNDGRTALSATSADLYLWDVRTGRLVRRYPCPDAGMALTCVAISPDGHRALSGSGDGAMQPRPGIVYDWDLESGSARPLVGHTDGVTGVAFCPDGRSAVSSSLDGTGRVWELERGLQVGIVRSDSAAHSGYAPLALAPDGRTALVGGSAKRLLHWDVAGGAVLREFPPNNLLRSLVLSVAVSPDGRMGLSGSSDNTLRLWDLSSGRLVRWCSR